MSLDDIPVGGRIVASDPTIASHVATEGNGGFAAETNEAAIGAIHTARLLVGGTWRASIASGVVYQYTSATPAGGFANGTWTPFIFNSANGQFTPGVATVATANVTKSGEQTLSGVTTSASRVLLVGQTAPAENGLWNTAPGPWARASDANTAGAFVIGKTVFVIGGTSAGAVYGVSVAPTVLGTDPIRFAVNSAGAAVVDWTRPGYIGANQPGKAVFQTLAFPTGYAPSFGDLVSSDGDADLLVDPSEYSSGHIAFGDVLTADRKRGFPEIAGAFWDLENATTGGHNIIAMIGTAGPTFSGSQILIPPGATVRVMVSTRLHSLVSSGGGGDSLETLRTSSGTFSATKNIHPQDSSGGVYTLTFPVALTLGERHLIPDWGGAIETNAITVQTGTSVKVQHPLTGDRSASSFSWGVSGGTGFRNGACLEFQWNGTLWVSLR